MGNMGPGGEPVTVFISFEIKLIMAVVSPDPLHLQEWMEWALATWGGEWGEEVEEEEVVCTKKQTCVTVDSGPFEKLNSVFSDVGMDNFGGMNNNMDRFGSSGVGRMNGEFWDALNTLSQTGNTSTFSQVFLIVSSLALLEMDRGIGGAFDREFGRNEMGMSRNNFGDSFERGMG